MIGLVLVALPQAANMQRSDTTCGLACEDRNLPAEARDEIAVASAWFEAVCRLYPAKSIAN